MVDLSKSSTTQTTDKDAIWPRASHWCRKAPFTGMSGRLTATLRVTLVSGVLALTACQTTGPLDENGKGPTDPAAAARNRTAIAAEYIRQGELDAAKRNLEQALEANPKSAQANNMMGILLQREGSEPNLVKAEAYYRKAISLQKDYAQAHNNYGVYLSERKRLKEALAEFSIAASTLGYEERGSALENLGRIQLQLGNPEGAEKSFMQALQVNRDSLVSRFELAELLLTQGKLSTASDLYDDYLRLLGANPQGARSLWLGMRIAMAQHDMDRFHTLADRLRLEFPDSPEFRDYQRQAAAMGGAWN